MQHAYCFLLLALLFRKVANMRIFHSERSNPENTYTLLYFAGILFKGKLQKEILNFSFILARARSRLCRQQTRCEVSPPRSREDCRFPQ